MLVLTRAEGESIKIGDDITMTVIKVMPNMVRLGFEAPKEIPIDRAERRNEEKSSD